MISYSGISQRADGQTKQKCPVCNGTGRVDTNKHGVEDACPLCARRAEAEWQATGKQRGPRTAA